MIPYKRVTMMNGTVALKEPENIGAAAPIAKIDARAATTCPVINFVMS
jgi:hypothetical protein